MTPDVTAQPRFERIQAARGLHDPLPIDLPGKRFHLPAQVGIARKTAVRSLGNFQQICENTIEQRQNIFKRFPLLLRKLSSGRKNFAVLFSRNGLVEKPQHATAQTYRFRKVQLEGGAGTATGEMCGQLTFRRFQIGTRFQEGLDLLGRDRCEMELQAARADRRQKRIGR